MAGERVVELVREGVTARQIVTKESLENAIRVDMALGGSTNTTLHIPASAHAAGERFKLAACIFVLRSFAIFQVIAVRKHRHEAVFEGGGLFCAENGGGVTDLQPVFVALRAAG